MTDRPAALPALTAGQEARVADLLAEQEEHERLLAGEERGQAAAYREATQHAEHWAAPMEWAGLPDPRKWQPPRRLRQRRRCTAHRSDGQPCRNWAMHGGWVCHAHGGRAPQVRAAARRRLEMQYVEAYAHSRFGRIWRAAFLAGFAGSGQAPDRAGYPLLEPRPAGRDGEPAGQGGERP